MSQLIEVNFALQGGGAYAAFSWGTLDRFLEDKRIIISGFSATSGGSLNAVVLMQGYLRDGRDGARQALYDFWKEISVKGLGLTMKTPIDYLYSSFLPAPFSLLLFQNMLKMLSPYQFNFFNINPLKDTLESMVNIDEVVRESKIALFLCATNVKTGNIHIFNKKQLSIDAVLASACLPYLFKAIEIDNEFYWDGGYLGNPAIYPLIYHSDIKDIMLLNITPLERNTIPTNIEDIITRSKEISFNSSLMRELRAIDFITKIIDDSMIKDEYKDRFKRVYLHTINSENVLSNLPMVNMLNTDWQFLKSLYDAGREAADLWLKENYDNIGKKSTFDFDSWTVAP